GPEGVAVALVADDRRQGDDTDASDDRRARSADANAADRGILRSAEDARCADGAAAVQRGVPRHGLEAVELHSHAAVHDAVVQEVLARIRRTCHDIRGAWQIGCW